MTQTSSQSPDRGLLSQVPFNTQALGNKSPRRSQTDHIYITLPKPALTTRFEGNGITQTPTGGQQQSHITMSPGDTGLRMNSAPGGVSFPPTTLTPDASIPYEPLGMPRGESATPLPRRETASSGTPSHHQPFSLFQWIERIRKEEIEDRPTLRIRWARSIPKRQRTILDTDDAWYPPLPGRPPRQGTIPIDTLTHLTDEVDCDAEIRTREKYRAVSEVATPTVDHTVEGLLTYTNGPALASQVGSNTPVDHEEDLPWSSSPPSPPRNRLPPDTSPPQPVRSEIQHAAHSVHNDFISPTTPSQVNCENQNAAIDMDLDALTTGKHVTSLSKERTFTTPLGTEDVIVVTDDKPRVVMHEDLETSVTDSHRMDVPAMPTYEASPMRATRKLGSKVLIKNTPHLSKAVRDNDSEPKADDFPGSSLVAATCPDPTQLVTAAKARRQSTRQRASLPIDVDHTTNMASEKAVIETKRRLVRRSMQTPSGKHCHISMVSKGITPQKFSPKVDQRTRVENHTAFGALSASGSTPLDDRRSLNSSSQDTAAKMNAFQRRRKEESRKFRQKYGKKVEMLDEAEITAEHVSDKAKPATATSGSSLDNANEVGSRLGDETTSETDVSAHSRAQSRESPKLLADPTPSAKGVKCSESNAERLLQRFSHAYPDYKGKQSTFNSALELIRKLDLHPSLFDDFVFRMADEYKKFLLRCVELDRDAIPYKEYYYTHVKQPKCRQNVITAESIAKLGAKKDETPSAVPESLRRQSDGTDLQPNGRKSDPVKLPRKVMQTSQLPLQTVRRSLLNHTSTEKTHDVEETPSILLSNGQNDTVLVENLSNASPQTLHIIDDGSCFHAGYKTAVQPAQAGGPRAHSAITNMNVAKADLAGKRRSFPWGSSLPVKPSSLTQISDIASALTEPEDLTSNVERWLNRPAGASSPEIETAPNLTPQLSIPSESLGINASSTKESVTSVKAHKLLSHIADTNPLNDMMVAEHVASAEMTSKSPNPPQSIDGSNITNLVAPKQFPPFARAYGSLQSEKPFHGPKGLSRRLPVNMYNW